MTDHEPLGTGSAALPSGTGASRTVPVGEDITAEFGAFYRGFVARLVGFLVWQGARAAVAAELAQETMFDAYRSWSEIEHAEAWARSVASRKLVRHMSRAEEDPLDAFPETSALLPLPDALAEWENRSELRDLLPDLPPRQRQVLAWYVTGYTPTEIAGELRIEPAAVRANLMKARRAAARFLAGREEDDA